MLFTYIYSQLPIYTPKKHLTSPKHLSEYLVQNKNNDSDKVVAIWQWITHNIKYNIKDIGRNEAKYGDAQYVLKKKKANALGYATLFTALCREANIAAYTVPGYCKMSSDYELYNQFFRERYAWNSVEINRKWYLLDATAGAGKIVDHEKKWKKKLGRWFYIPKWLYQFKFEYDSTYFLTNPKQLAITHNPADPMWQLLNCIVPIELFEKPPGYTAYYVKTYDSCSVAQDIVRTEVIRYTPDEQELRSAFTAKAFNKKNHGYAGFTALKYADKYFNGVPYTNNKAELLGKARFLYDSAVVFLKATAKDIEEEYKFLRKQNLQKKKMTQDTNTMWLKLNQRTIQKNKTLIKNQKDKIKKLYRQNNNLDKQAQNIIHNKDNLERVPNAKNPPTQTQIQKIEENQQKIQQNLRKFDQIKDSAMTAIEQYAQTYSQIYKILDKILVDYKLFTRYITQNIQERIMQKADAYWDYFMLRRADMIQRHANQAKWRDSIPKLYAFRYNEIKGYLAGATNRMKGIIAENKALIKQNKQLKNTFGSEDDEYQNAKEKIEEVNNVLKKWNEGEINFLQSLNKEYRSHNRNMRLLNKAYKVENIKERQRYKFREKQYKHLYKVEMAKQKKAYHHAVTQRKKCKETIDAYLKE
ncbi:MAG: hypothetical protein NZ455_13625 [Bacteroidia bacterium]|nr:hypothetical protein [Bacteroidia bacterium]MDW8347080.1 transglutaminase domain-containing protein [Bacteroidia bacterium]